MLTLDASRGVAIERDSRHARGHIQHEEHERREADEIEIRDEICRNPKVDVKQSRIITTITPSLTERCEATHWHQAQEREFEHAEKVLEGLKWLRKFKVQIPRDGAH